MHTTAITNANSIMTMGLQAGAGQKQSAGLNQKPAVFMDEFSRFSRSTGYGPLCRIPSMPDVFVRICYVFAVDPDGYISTADGSKRKALPGFMTPLKILVLMNHINDICDGQLNPETNKPDEFSNIAIEEFEKYKIDHGKPRAVNDLSWLGTMQEKWKLDPPDTPLLLQ